MLTVQHHNLYNYRNLIFEVLYCMGTDNNKQLSTKERADFDGLWKEAIERFLHQLLMRTLPALYNDADFSVPPEFLSKELRDTIQRPVAEEHNAPLFVDELIKIRLKNGHSEWILLHIEIQGSGGDDISFRMMLYCSLIFAHHRKMPVGLAILTKPRPKGEIIGTYTTEQYGASISYNYNCFEVYNQDDNALLQSDNPFDRIFLATKNTISLSGKSKEEKKFSYLIQLTKLLASKGWNIEDRRDIFNFIVRAVNLKDAALRQKFVKEIQDFQRGENMRTLSFVEEYFRDEGLERGRREEKFETARRLREMGMKDNDIHRATNLSFEDIRTL